MNLVPAHTWFARRTDFFGHIFVGNAFNAVVFAGRINGALARIILVRRVMVIFGWCLNTVVCILVSSFDCGLWRCLFRFDRFRDLWCGLHDHLWCVCVCHISIGSFACVAVKFDHVHRTDFRISRDRRIICNRIFGNNFFAPTTASAARPLLGLTGFFLCGLRFGKLAFFRHQGFAVGDRDLVIVGVNFRKSQKAVAVSAIIHKGCL